MGKRVFRIALVLVGTVFLIEGIALGFIGFSLNQAIEKQLSQAMLSTEIFSVSVGEQSGFLQPFQFIFFVLIVYSGIKAVIGAGLIYLGNKIT